MKVVLAGIAFCLGSLTANAALVEYKFSATLTNQLSAGQGPWSQNLDVGATGYGSVFIDTSVPDSYGGTALVTWSYPGAWSANFTLAGMTVTATSGHLETLSLPYSDYGYGLLSSNVGSATGLNSGWIFSALSLVFVTNRGDQFFENSLPDPYDPANFETRFLSLQVRDGSDQGSPTVNAMLTVDSMERVVANAIPEPTSLALVGAGLLGMAGLRKRQARRR